MKKISRFRRLIFRLTRLGLLGIFFLVLTNTPARAVGEPDLTISKTHTGTFSPLDVGRTYTITVSNIGESPTAGTVTVVDTLPNGLSATAINGDGWGCTLATLTCTRSDSLNNGEDYPVITVTVNVLVGATDPQTNQADVSGGGEVDTFNNTALDDTTIDAKADLIVTGYQLLNSDKSAVIPKPGVDEVFYIRMRVENQGGAASGSFYPGVFLDDKPNYGPDHDDPGPPLLVWGDITDYQGYKRTPTGAASGAGCMYYDPTNSIDPMTTPIVAERGNYTLTQILPSLPANSWTIVDVEIAYPVAHYPAAIYDDDDVRTGLKLGGYQVYLYADPNCSGGNEESSETNNSYGPVYIVTGAEIDADIGGVNQGSYYLAPNTSDRVNFSGINNGPAEVTNLSGGNTLASTRVLFGGVSYSEMMGFPADQLTNEYVFPYYNNTAMDSQLRVSNLGVVSTTINVYVGSSGTPIDTYTLAAGAATRKNYVGVNNGPLRVTSSATNIITTIRVLYGGLSYSELVGFPANQLTTEYIFPYYNNVAMDSQLRISNVGGSSTTINVYVGSNPTPIDTYTLAAGAATRKNYAGINSGPLKVTSSTSNILTTIRVLFSNLSYSELLGFPVNQLTTAYSYPVYNNVAIDSQLRVSNVGNATTTITVYSGSTQIDSYDLAAGAATRINYSGVNNGPLRVESSGQPILTTTRMLYYTSSFSSYYEMTGYPNNQLHTEYVFPWYNNTAMDSEVRFAIP